MDDAARRAREIACTCGGHGGHTVGYCPLSLIGPAADALVASVTAALREVETEMGRRSSFALLTWQNNWRAACQERDALAARLARVEAERNAAWAKLGYLTTALAPDATTEGP